MRNPFNREAIAFIQDAVRRHRGVLAGLLAGNFLLVAGEGAIALLLKSLLFVFFSPGGTIGDSVDLASLLPGDLAKAVGAGWPVAPGTLKDIIVWGIVTASVARAGGNFLFNYKLQVFMLKVTERLRAVLVERILGSSYLQVQRLAPNEWMSRILNDTRFIQARGGEALASLIRDTSVLALVLIYLFAENWTATLAVAAAAPFIGRALGGAGRMMGRYAEAFQKQLAKMANLLSDMRLRSEFIKAQGGEGFERAHFAAFNQGYFEYMRRTLPLRSFFAPGVEWAGMLLFCGMVVAATLAWGPGSLDTGFVAYCIVLMRGVKSIKNLSENIIKAGEMTGAMKEVLSFARMFEANAGRPALSGGEERARTAVQVTARPPLVRIRKVTVAFAERPVVTLADMVLTPGRVIGLVGASGSGKSTWLRCLAGLIPPSEWDASQAWEDVVARGNFVSQSPFFFEGTLASNLAYGAASPPSDAQARRVLDGLGLHAFSDTLNGAIGPALSDTGGVPQESLARNRFSGGELQRLTIARALLRGGRDILLLDEVTSALDIRTEELVTAYLREHVRARGLCCLVVTHRLEATGHFDELWRAEDGRIFQ